MNRLRTEIVWYRSKVLKADPRPPSIDYNMRDDKCIVELRPDKRHVWVLLVGEGCSEVINTIHDGLGPFGRQYLDDRFVYPELPEKQKLSMRVPVNFSIPNLQITE